ncbi:long-chain fatty acid--CoA ligase [Rhodococcus sp. BP-349]|uniref:AMP-dependent synthetase/ligase n=1 Tax=unclassified Rhodococcus (in: high G+C Gram-positive bacteria) TaxID=192944 RepID=UPI001C9B1AD8|nr:MULTISPECIES: long-chain fatty acid--CoA ligase [unclassified Rhodococcus (in: high G+C Gram-positive bacteria)]MBY6540714.1 long-chain fatty acid--CoA ligase [Rhodococcus sp. BP-363]MBY6545261.1 long-chain fatty acid--CoA ligase [Rhodococcus sp. BP-369]MBY6564491.1 long-chain fatty acid--CoA ligase [Rhodococcus sp. BP-370]MBY6578573.1 long-chain fatty acid--CoA ligase [Rhodococcus sp. BP-364]MBY6587874.1 long-chain fatty acid--CoA ligase [Rhodococcus sp. BP-358]
MREFTVPAPFTIEDDASVVDAVFAHEKTRPDVVVYRRATRDGWSDVRAADFAAQVRAVAKGLIASGVKQGDRVALMSSTRYEWPLLDYAIWSAGAVTVPVYETSSSDQVRWILENSGAAAMIAETVAHTNILTDILPVLPGVATVLQIDASAERPGAIDVLTDAGAQITDATVADRVAALRSSDPATLVFTSGTTGRPKGCVLTHSNLIAESRGIAASSIGRMLTEGRTTLMFLPMAHVLARAVSIAAFDQGATLGHTHDIPHLVDNFGSFRPHFILSVPRVFEKVYNTARQKAHGDGKGKIFDAAADTAVAYSAARDTGGPSIVLRVKHALFDRLVYGKLRAALGGQCELAISGGAPLGERLAHFYRGIGVTIYEGYGLTETTAAAAVNTPDEQRIGTVGKPLPGNAVRIADDGEILLKGGVVFEGYWKNDDATDEALTDGWFHTGDLGAVDEDGFIAITGRKKEIIVTAGGKNVSPAGLEDSLRASALIGQAMVVGDQKPFIGALITIDPDAFPGWKQRNGKDEGATVADLTKDPDLVAEIDAAVAEANKTVSHAESIKKYRILPADFTEEGGELTPTMKLKRAVVQKSYASDIEAIYSK